MFLYLVHAWLPLLLAIFNLKKKDFYLIILISMPMKKERETMDKKSHYRQSAIVFLLVGIAFLLLAIEIFFALKWLYPVVMLIVICMIIYAIVSSINIERKK